MSYVTDKFDRHVVELLQKSGVGLLPSDTIYGISCRALDRQAVERAHRLKGRDKNKPFIVLISDIKMLDLLSIKIRHPFGVSYRAGHEMNSMLGLSSRGKFKINESIEKYWPGQVTFILPAPSAPYYLTSGTDSLAIRLPDYPELISLIRKAGPIISTSANLQGQEPIKSVEEAKRLFGDKLDFYVDVGELDNPTSTLVELKPGKLNIIRQGAVTIDEKERYDT